MSVQPITSVPASDHAGKKRAEPKPNLRPRKNNADVALEDDDWIPLAAKLPARVAGEFIDNDYDMM